MATIRELNYAKKLVDQPLGAPPAAQPRDTTTEFLEWFDGEKTNVERTVRPVGASIVMGASPTDRGLDALMADLNSMPDGGYHLLPQTSATIFHRTVFSVDTSTPSKTLPDPHQSVFSTPANPFSPTNHLKAMMTTTLPFFCPTTTAHASARSWRSCWLTCGPVLR